MVCVNAARVPGGVSCFATESTENTEVGSERVRTADQMHWSRLGICLAYADDVGKHVIWTADKRLTRIAARLSVLADPAAFED
jgi:hypothetical protein